MYQIRFTAINFCRTTAGSYVLCSSAKYVIAEQYCTVKKCSCLRRFYLVCLGLRSATYSHLRPKLFNLLSPLRPLSRCGLLSKPYVRRVGKYASLPLGAVWSTPPLVRHQLRPCIPTMSPTPERLGGQHLPNAPLRYMPSCGQRTPPELWPAPPHISPIASEQWHKPHLISPIDSE